MTQFLNEALNQILEYRAIKVFYNLNDGAHAEEILNALDKSVTPTLKLYGIEQPEYPMSIYLYPTQSDWDKTGERPLSGPETIRIIQEQKIMMVCRERLPENLGFEIAYSFNLLLFHEQTKERNTGPFQWRTPSWLMEGICRMVPMSIRNDKMELLRKAWMNVQTNEKSNQLIQSTLMVKMIAMIPDKARKQLAFDQAYFMVKYLTILYPDGFVRKYATLMGALEDMEGEAVFKQITTNTFDKFFTLFREWVRTTNPWAAIAD